MLVKKRRWIAGCSLLTMLSCGSPTDSQKKSSSQATPPETPSTEVTQRSSGDSSKPVSETAKFLNRTYKTQTDIENRRTELDKEFEAAERVENQLALARLSIEKNYLTELEEALRNPNPDKQKEVVSKYKIICRIFDRSVEAMEEEALASQSEGFLSHDNHDKLYHRSPYTSVYHPLVLEQVQKVFRDFGDLYVNETLDASGKPTYVKVTTKDKPWAGYWYPLTDKVFYEGPTAPLNQWDDLLSKLKISSNSAKEERKRLESFHATPWAGYCDGFSYAAVNTEEPKEVLTVEINKATLSGEPMFLRVKRGSTFVKEIELASKEAIESARKYGKAGIITEEVKFSPSTQKALLTFSHLKYPYEQYGITYDGSVDTDGTYQDLMPEAVHKLAMHFLGELKEPLVMDDMPGVQVWNKPWFAYRYKIEKDPSADYAYLVSAEASLISHRKKETDDPTTPFDVVLYNYTYRLYVDKAYSNDKGFKVIAGQWLGDSYTYHPDNVKVPAKRGALKSVNTDFNKHIDLFEKIFVSTKFQ